MIQMLCQLQNMLPVMTPFAFMLPHSNLNLPSIDVDGHMLPIDSIAFESSNTRGTILDTGTTLAYPVKEAYDPDKLYVRQEENNGLSDDECNLDIHQDEENMPPSKSIDVDLYNAPTYFSVKKTTFG